MSTSTVLNKSQLHILQMFARKTTEQDYEELKSVLSDFYARKLDVELERLWDDGVIDEDKIEEFRRGHYRTPYKK